MVHVNVGVGGRVRGQEAPLGLHRQEYPRVDGNDGVQEGSQRAHRGSGVTQGEEGERLKLGQGRTREDQRWRHVDSSAVPLPALD